MNIKLHKYMGKQPVRICPYRSLYNIACLGSICSSKGLQSKGPGIAYRQHWSRNRYIC